VNHQYSRAAVSALDTEQNEHNSWFQLSDRPADVLSVIQYNKGLAQYNAVSVSVPAQPPLRDVKYCDPLSTDIKYRQPVADASLSDVKSRPTVGGPLSSDVKYPEVHAIPHVGGASYRRSLRGSLRGAATLSRAATFDRDLHRAPAPTNFLGGSLRRKSNDAGRPRDPRPPPGDGWKYDLSPSGDLGQSELEYRV